MRTAEAARPIATDVADDSKSIFLTCYSHCGDRRRRRRRRRRYIVCLVGAALGADLNLLLRFNGGDEPGEGEPARARNFRFTDFRRATCACVSVAHTHTQIRSTFEALS